MEENILACLENFDVLWQRVSPGSYLTTAPHNAPAETSPDLETLWKNSVALAQEYQQLSDRFHGAACALLRRHAQENSSQARRLKAEYFLRWGVCPCAAQEPRAHMGKLSCLRRLYLAEAELSRSLAEASQCDSDPSFTNCLSVFSQAAAQRAETDRKLLLRCF